MKTSQASEQIVEVGWRCGLHHLPAFVIVPYYCPYFSSALSKLSLALFSSLTIPCSALLCARLDESDSDWMTDCMSCIKVELSFSLFSKIALLKRTCRWISALLNHAWRKDIFCNKFMKLWVLRKHFQADWSVLFSFVLCTILLDSIAQWSIGKISWFNHCTFSSSKAKFVFLPPSYHCIILAVLAVTAFLHAHISLILTNGNNCSKIQSRQPISQLHQRVLRRTL